VRGPKLQQPHVLFLVRKRTDGRQRHA
jgi:hypothetical protein